jgi:hypothetical protein
MDLGYYWLQLNNQTLSPNPSTLFSRLATHDDVDQIGLAIVQVLFGLV